VVKRAEISKGIGVPFEVRFRKYQDLYQFLLIFDEKDFPDDKYPKGISLGILAMCPRCGRPDMAGGMDLVLIESNSRKVKDMVEKNGEIVAACLLCLLDLLGPNGMKEMCKETRKNVKAIEDQWENERKHLKLLH